MRNIARPQIETQGSNVRATRGVSGRDRLPRFFSIVPTFVSHSKLRKYRSPSLFCPRANRQRCPTISSPTALPILKTATGERNLSRRSLSRFCNRRGAYFPALERRLTFVSSLNESGQAISLTPAFTNRCHLESKHFSSLPRREAIARIYSAEKAKSNSSVMSQMPDNKPRERVVFETGVHDSRLRKSF